MTDLTTRYMGFDLKNPLIVASCGLTRTVEGVQQCAAAGPGAIVLKSLFEEQILAETAALEEMTDQTAPHTEAYDYLEGYGQLLGPRDYLKLVRDAKRVVDVPLIASINCTTDRRWAEYAGKLADAGADGLEINIGFLPNEARMTAAEVEERHERILYAVRSQVDLPIALKVGPYFSSFANLAARLGNDRLEAPEFTVGYCGPGPTSHKVAWKAADALVLFNRFYRFDIDVDTLQVAGGNPYSTSEESHLPLRWIALLAGRLDCDLAASTGIHDGRDLAKHLLAGASAAQVCSSLYRHGLERIDLILEQLRAWMQSHDFKTLDEFRGQLSQHRSDRPETFERLQYIKALVGIE